MYRVVRRTSGLDGEKKQEEEEDTEGMGTAGGLGL